MEQLLKAVVAKLTERDILGKGAIGVSLSQKGILSEQNLLKFDFDSTFQKQWKDGVSRHGSPPRTNTSKLQLK